MKSLYSSELCGHWAARAKRCLLLCALILGLSLAVCVYLCGRVTTGTAAALLWWVIILSILAGWAAMGLVCFVYFPARAQHTHMKGILQGDAEEYWGTLHVLGEKIHIPQSVDIYKVALKEGDESKTFHINAHLLSLLPPNGTRVHVTAVRKFITAYEVEV